MSHESELVVVTMSDGRKYTGKLDLAGKVNVQDTLNDAEQFLVLRSVSGDDGTSLRTLILNKQQIVTAARVNTSDTHEFHIPGFTSHFRKDDEPGS